MVRAFLEPRCMLTNTAAHTLMRKLTWCCHERRNACRLHQPICLAQLGAACTQQAGAWVCAGVLGSYLARAQQGTTCAPFSPSQHPSHPSLPSATGCMHISPSGSRLTSIKCVCCTEGAVGRGSTALFMRFHQHSFNAVLVLQRLRQSAGEWPAARVGLRSAKLGACGRQKGRLQLAADAAWAAAKHMAQEQDRWSTLAEVTTAYNRLRHPGSEQQQDRVRSSEARGSR